MQIVGTNVFDKQWLIALGFVWFKTVKPGFTFDKYFSETKRN